MNDYQARLDRTAAARAQAAEVIAQLTAKGRAFMQQVGKGRFDFFDDGIVEGSGNWGENMAQQLECATNPKSASGIMGATAKLGLWNTWTDEGQTWWDLTALGAAVAQTLAEQAATTETVTEAAPTTEKEITMPDTKNPIRDLREAKRLSEDDVAAAAGLTYSKFVRIQQGSPRTTQAEIDAVVKVINKMKAKDRKLAGRPFADKSLQAKLDKAREKGESVAAILGATVGTEPAKKAAPAKATKAQPAKKAAAKKATPAKKAQPAKATAADASDVI